MLFATFSALLKFALCAVAVCAFTLLVVIFVGNYVREWQADRQRKF